MNQIKQFLTKYSITTHSIAALFATAVIAYNQVPAFQSYVISIYNALPKGVDAAILAAIGLYTWYRNGEQPVAAPKTWYQKNKK